MIIYTYEEIAEELGITRSAVRKIEQRAMRKVRKALKRKGMTLDDLIPDDTHFEPESIPWDISE
jgi:predicted transcriptional regulator